MSIPTQNLPGGYKIPVIGFGTTGRETEKVLPLALEAGYRHIDTAYMYKNEAEIGRVLKQWLDSGKVKRSELFIVTKLPPEANTPSRVEEYLNRSLKSLQLDYVDLYLIHHPIWREPVDPTVRFGDSIVHPTDHIALWKKMEEQVDAGRTKTIGLSNFNISQIENIMKIARIKPASLQIENHIYLQQEELVRYCQDNGIVVVAYSPLGVPGRVDYKEESGLPKHAILDPTIAKIADKYKKSPGQVMLRFLLQQNIVVIPKSSSPIRMKDNIEVLNFTLSDEDINTIRGLEVGERARISSGVPYKENVTSHPEWPFPRNVPYYAIQKPLTR